MASLNLCIFPPRMLSRMFSHMIWSSWIVNWNSVWWNFLVVISFYMSPNIMTHICIEMPKIPNLFAFTSATNQWSLKCFLVLIKGEETLCLASQTTNFLSRDCLHRAQRGNKFATILGTPWKQGVLRYCFNFCANYSPVIYKPDNVKLLNAQIITDGVLYLVDGSWCLFI